VEYLQTLEACHTNIDSCLADLMAAEFDTEAKVEGYTQFQSGVATGRNSIAAADVAVAVAAAVAAVAVVAVAAAAGRSKDALVARTLGGVSAVAGVFAIAAVVGIGPSWSEHRVAAGTCLPRSSEATWTRPNPKYRPTVIIIAI